MTWGEGEVVVQISAIEHHGYCPRQAGLIHIDGLWADNVATTKGNHEHRRVDSGEHRRERGRLVLRSIPLWSETYGLSGRADAVEIWPDGRVVPVEYKSGTRHGLTADRQLCAQALCLEEMLGRPVTEGFIWYGGPRRRHPVPIDEALRSDTLATIAEVRAMVASGRLPPAVHDERCPVCQLEPMCLPEVTSRPSSPDDYVHGVVFGCDT